MVAAAKSGSLKWLPLAGEGKERDYLPGLAGAEAGAGFVS
jgi:hypothetical protein